MFDFLNKLKLSVTQWALVTLAAALGWVVFLLRQEGRKLHRTKVELLRVKHETADKAQSLKVDNAKQAYEKALKEYEDAKNRVGR